MIENIEDAREFIQQDVREYVDDALRRIWDVFDEDGPETAHSEYRLDERTVDALNYVLENDWDDLLNMKDIWERIVDHIAVELTDFIIRRMQKAPTKQ